MKNLRVLFLVPLMLLGAFLVPHAVHAGTGVVSVNHGTLIGVPSSATTVSVPIQISLSNPYNGFDILVSADPTILRASSVSVAGSVLNTTGAMKIAVECIDGILVAGTTCYAQDNPGVVHFAAAALGSTTTASGTLFTINYNIVGASGNTPITFVSFTPGVCALISDGTTTPVPESCQAGTFSNLINFSMKAFTKVSTTAGTPITDVISYASLGGFADIVKETLTTSSGLTATFTSSHSTTGAVSLLGPTGSDSLVLTAAANGDYAATVKACGTNKYPTTCNTLTIDVLVGAPAISVQLFPTYVQISRGNSDNSTIVELFGSSGFSGSVSLTASSLTSGITGSAPSATLTPNASGYSAVNSTLTISVASAVATGNYTVSVSGMGGTLSSNTASMTVNVPEKDFKVGAVPSEIGIVRGGTVAANINVVSLGNLAGPVTLSVSVTPVAGQQDSCCNSTNISPSFSPASPSLGAGQTLTIAFFASTVGGTAPASTYTATGNYTATITATVGGIPHSVVIHFSVQDFGITGSFCDWSTTSGANQSVIDSTPNANVGPGILVGQPCTTLTITAGSGIQDPLNGQGIFGNPTPYVLWVKTNAFGGLVTDGFDGLPSIAALNPEIPARGFTIPALSQVLTPTVDQRMCLLQTYWPNGTQIPYSYLKTHGPLIAPGGGLYVGLDELGVAGVSGIPWGCTFDAQTFPNDVVGVQAYNNHFQTTCDKDKVTGKCTDSDIAADGVNFDTNECVANFVGFSNERNFCPYPVTDNADAFQVVAMTITDPTTGAQLTAPGAYTFKLCGQAGVLIHCSTYGLNVITQSPQISDLHWDHSASVSHNRPIMFGVGLYNPSTTPLYMQAVISATADNGNSFTVFGSVILVQQGTNVQNTKVFSPTFTNADIGTTYSFTVQIFAGVSSTGLTVFSSDVTTLFGGSGLNSGSVVIKP